MKTRTKRILLLSLCLALLAVCGVFAFAANDTEYKVVDHVVYRLIPATNKDDAYYSVCSLFDTEEAKKTVKSLTVQSEIDGVPVRDIYTVWTDIDTDNEPSVIPYAPDRYIAPDNAACTSITLPDSIRAIGEQVFAGMTRLKKINLPTQLEILDGVAFFNCYALRSVDIPAKLRTIGYDAFYNCRSLKSVKLHEGLEEIGAGAFAGCESLSSIKLPQSLQRIYSGAFQLTAIRTMKIPEHCSTANLDGMGKLEKVVFADRSGKYSLPMRAFFGCYSLKKVSLPQSAKVTLGAYAFYSCISLEKIYHGDSIVKIGMRAFYHTDALAGLTLSANLKKITEKAFTGCTGLKKLRILASDAAFLQNGNAFHRYLPQDCRVFVKTDVIRQALLDAGCKNRVIVKADLK